MFLFSVEGTSSLGASVRPEVRHNENGLECSCEPLAWKVCSTTPGIPQRQSQCPQMWVLSILSCYLSVCQTDLDLLKATVKLPSEILEESQAKKLSF